MARKKVKKILSYKVWIIILLAIALISVWMIVKYMSLPDLSGYETVELIIPKGSTPDAVSDSLLKKSLIAEKKTFMFWLTSMEKDRDLKAGFYDVPKDLTYPQLVTYLTTARSKEIKVTLIEGWTIRQIAGELAATLQCDPDRFTRLCYDSSFIHKLGLNTRSLEGYLLPDTYFFYWGMAEEDVIKFLVNKTLAIFSVEVKARLDSMNMTIHQVLTLASIIEGEALFDAERDTISSVYYNRLARRIKLQADPTIQYILDGPPRRLLYKDLEIDSPYNTYKYYGLPPGPINNPGSKSIMAAIYPANTRYLYFVARGDGRHSFSRTAQEHARAKAEFEKVRREVYRKQRLQNR